jgi:hypothetical protein
MEGIEHLSTLRISGMIILKTEIKEVVYECMDWVQLAQVMVQWRALVNTVMNF